MQKIIPLTDVRRLAPEPRAALSVLPAGTRPVDRLARPLRDLRISVTDRCNFRCVYCMPKASFGKDHLFLRQSALLSFEEIERLARAFVALGVEKIRLTGGEPLLRKHIERLVEKLARLRTLDGEPLELTLTTNGSVLERKARQLRDAGLSRITVSLDALDDPIFRQLNDVDFPVADVLRGIEAAVAAGLAPVKVNMVVKRGMNEQQILPMARYFRDTGVILRFIEYMDVGSSNGWSLADMVPSADVVAAIHREMPLVPAARQHASETAERWRYADGGGEIGVISSVSHAFCHACTRARLSTEGRLFLCLFAHEGHDLRALLRGDDALDEAHLHSTIAHIWQQRDDRYSALRGQAAAPVCAGEKVEMSYIGG